MFKFSPERILADIESLASDHFLGRKPGTAGEAVTLEFLIAQCQEIGLAPAGDHNTFLQHINVRGIESKPALTLKSGDQQIRPAYPDQYVAMSRKASGVEHYSSEIVFVGYGIQAPEYSWDDYKGVDVRGKTVLMLIGDPRRSLDNGDCDQSFFRGNGMTYYGRWTYKFEMAARMGAAACLIVHDQLAGYNFDVVKASWSGESFDLVNDDLKLEVQGWLSQPIAEQLFAQENLDFAFAKQQAQLESFTPRVLGAVAEFAVENKQRFFSSANVIAKLEPEQSGQDGVVYSAHWDHFGQSEAGIYSGAVDNGSGVAAILEIARAFKSLPAEDLPGPVFFLFTTLEESGLLGSEHYVAQPTLALKNTLAVFNVDILNVWGRTRDVISIALGHSTLDHDLEHCAAEQGRRVVADPEPEKGYFYRSDHLHFIRRGVPAIFFLQPGSDFIDRDPDFGQKVRRQYLNCDYHKITDKVKPEWDLRGIAEDADLIFKTGLRVLRANQAPSWFANSEFK